LKIITTAAIALVCFCALAYGQAPSDKPGPATPVEVVNTPSNAVPTTITSTKVTHVGRSPQDHVTLGLASGSNDTCPTKGSGWFGFIERSQDSSFEGFFVVPAGKSLILTDFGIGALKGEGWAVGDLISFQLGRVGDATRVYETRKTVDAAAAAATSIWMNEHVISGIVFRGGQVPCAKTGLGSDATGNHGTTASIVTGYLVDE
jgi:hypothetical protein